MKSKHRSKFSRYSERGEYGFTGEFVSLGEALMVLLDKHEEKLQKMKVEMAWGKVFDDYVKKQTNRLYFNAGLLAVNIDSPSLRNEMFLNKTHIIEQLNLAIGEKLILEIAFY
jgi:hypothetical protein